ncbi:hypothetical protein [Enterobacter hormaechei]|nr:hypothetical protein [Enterobacter hormaechei]MCL8077196.1 hypothetical protein [Enterobacter hormaechei]MCM6986698.1 hypothetical protein [Enterobacter hormaechei]MCM7056812.1 hypothetical protein [Enterobacter hormaechei]
MRYAQMRQAHIQRKWKQIRKKNPMRMIQKEIKIMWYFAGGTKKPA